MNNNYNRNRDTARDGETLRPDVAHNINDTGEKKRYYSSTFSVGNDTLLMFLVWKGASFLYGVLLIALLETLEVWQLKNSILSKQRWRDMGGVVKEELRQ